MELTKVLRGIAEVPPARDCLLTNINYNSKKIRKHDLFVAIKGLQADGHDYLKQAAEKGACAALVEKVDKSINLYQIAVPNTRQALAQVAANYYNNPTRSLCLIGVTGTNGKTTTTFMLESIFQAADQKTGLIGTVRSSIGDKAHPVNHTTPESLELQKLFAEMVDSHVKTVVMEVSSHASDLYRVDNCHFDQVLFTNLTQDHLDYHKDFEQYFAAKKRFFDINPDATHIINVDDEYGQRLVEERKGSKVITYSLSSGADFWADDVKINEKSSSFNGHFGGHIFRFEIMLGGLFNIYNALAAVASASVAGIEPEVIQQGFYNLEQVPGRFEILSIEAPFKVIVDYAHTPDGLDNLLRAAREITEGRLITVFGCGGERDIGKRPKMGKIASNLSDITVVTSDNPRAEDPLEIIKQVCKNNGSFVTEVDRRQAIEVAFREADAGDTIVIAGKGHEKTQEIGGKHLPFEDQEVTAEVWRQIKKQND